MCYLFYRIIQTLTNNSPASTSTSSQPKSVAIAEDGTAFIAEASHVEVFKSNQKAFDYSPKFSPSSIAVYGSLVAIGGEVRFALTLALQYVTFQG